MRSRPLLLLSLASLGCPRQESTPATSATAPDSMRIFLEAARVQPEENLVLSPDNIAATFAPLQAGAAPDVQASLASALGTFNLERAAAGEDAEGLLLRRTTGIWVDTGVNLNPAWKTRVERSTRVENVPFSSDPEAQRTAINGWVRQSTENLIDSLLPPGSVTADTRLVVAGAIVLRAKWKLPFDRAATFDAPFHAPGGERKVPTMHQLATLPHFEDDIATAVALPYLGDKWRMVWLVPKTNLADLRAKMNPAWIERVLSELAPTRVGLSLPRWQMELARPLDLEPLLRNLGVRGLFCGDAKPDALAEIATGGLCVTRALHKAMIRVDETGTEAAAATGGVVGITSVGEPPRQVQVDRPSLFFVTDGAGKEVLFAGQMVSP